MRKTEQANEIADGRAAGAATHGVPGGLGSGLPFIKALLRRARLRTRKAVEVEGKDLEGTTPTQPGSQDPGSDAARSSMEAGLTRGVSLLFSNRS
jgi:hypothetical protein